MPRCRIDALMVSNSGLADCLGLCSYGSMSVTRRTVTPASLGAVSGDGLASGVTVPVPMPGPWLGATAVERTPNLILPHPNLITRRPLPVHGLQGYLRITCGKCRDRTNYFCESVRQITKSSRMQE